MHQIGEDCGSWPSPRTGCSTGCMQKRRRASLNTYLSRVFLGQVETRVVFTRGSYRKGVRVPIGVPGRGGFGSGSAGWWGVVFLWKIREEGKGVGRVRGWGGDRQRNRQVNGQALSELPFSSLPFSSLPFSFSPVLGPRKGGVDALLECRSFWGGNILLTVLGGQRKVIITSLASRKRCDLKTRKRCDFYSAAQKIASDFSGDFFCDFFWRFLCDFCGKTLRISTLRFENAAIFLRLRFFGTLR